MQAYSFVGTKLSAALSAGSPAPWQDVELAVSLLYQMGEGAPDDALKTGALPAEESLLSGVPATMRLVSCVEVWLVVEFGDTSWAYQC